MLISVCDCEVRNNFSLKEEESNKKSDKTSNKNQGDYKKVLLLFIKFTYFTNCVLWSFEGLDYSKTSY